MLASSSPPKLSRVRHGPRSSATTRTPASVSTLAAVAPDAPAPMMQTSVRSGLLLRGLALDAMMRLPLLMRRIGVPRGKPVGGGVAAGMHLGQRGRAREADDLPADTAAVAAIDRVG